MTNPDNAIGTNAAYNGRTSVNAFNDVLAALSRGVVSGFACKPSSGMTVRLGGSATIRDVAIAEDNSGNKVTINNINNSPVSVTLSAAHGANSRIDAIVAYVDGAAKGSSDVADNPTCCGLIAVDGTTASAPSVPNDSAIRSAITSDGANGTSAYYVILATVRVTNGLTTITQNNIMAGDVAKLSGQGVVTSSNIDFATYSTSEQLVGKWIDGRDIYRRTINLGSLPNNTSKSVAIGTTIRQLIKLEGTAYRSSDGTNFPLPFVAAQAVEPQPDIQIFTTSTEITVQTTTDRSNLTAYITIEYTKN